MTREELARVDDVNWRAASGIIAAGEEHCPIVMCIPDGPVVDVSSFLMGRQGREGRDNNREG